MDNKNIQEIKDTVKTAGAALLACSKTGAAFLPLDGDLHVAVGTLAGIAHAAGKSMDDVAPAVQAQAELTDANELREIAVILEREGYRMNAMKLRQIALRSAASSASPAAVVRDALETIAQWNLPVTGKTWDDGSPMSYGAAFGSNGERDYMRQIAVDALTRLAAPTSDDVRSAAREQARNEALEEAANLVTEKGEPGVARAVLALKTEAPVADVSDKALLDLLDKWIVENHAEGWKQFYFAFDTSGTAREQIAEQMPRPEAPTASKEGNKA